MKKGMKEVNVKNLAREAELQELWNEAQALGVMAEEFIAEGGNFKDLSNKLWAEGGESWVERLLAI